MTVCIAAVCNSGHDIVIASDRMITIRELQYEPDQPKVAQLANRTMALVAGDMQLHASVIPKVLERIKSADDDNPHKINVADIAEFYAEEFAFYQRKLAEREILFPLGLDFDRFIRRQSTMAHYQVTHLQDLLTSYRVDSTAIIAGLDSTGAHIYKISYGVPMCFDTSYFACAGSGEPLATTQFMVARFEKNWPLAKALWLTFSAKTKAEAASGVGQHTDLIIVRPDGDYILDNGRDMGESAERQAGVEELELEVKVTPQMLEAGKYALFPNEVLPWYKEEEVLAKIFRAMATAGAHS